VTDRLAGITTVTFDFGNTLVPVGRAALRRVVEITADAVVRLDPAIDRDAFLSIWGEERERQFRENVPQFREVDIAERLVRVFARLRGMPAPGVAEPWDQDAAATWSSPAEVEGALDRYSLAFVEGLPPVPGVDELLERLVTEGRTLAILSNWPLVATIDRYAEARGWMASLAAIVVSQRVGVIKPHPAFFAAARDALGRPDPGAILHVGDDWAADVVGASDAAWRTAWISERPGDSPLPSSEPGQDRRADLTLTRVTELADRLEALAGGRAEHGASGRPSGREAVGEGRGP
jgi:FMN phosphatase YigB (HAD superfamily)